jgi:polyisoprenoid-binding protein YceI
MIRTSALLLSAALLAAPAAAQAPSDPPGRADVSRVTGGTYKVDSNHTQAIWTVDHLGVSPLSGMFGGMSGTLRLDPARPAAAQLNIEIPLTGLTTPSEGFGKHLRTPDFFDAAKFPTARFVSTSVRPQGTRATITGDLTMHGVTKPVVLQAAFHGAGPNPRNKAENLGFTATTTLKRSDWGLGYGVPMVGDTVKLQIVGAFEKQG